MDFDETIEQRGQDGEMKKMTPEEARRLQDSVKNKPEIQSLKQPMNSMLYVMAHYVMPAVVLREGGDRVWKCGEGFLDAMPKTAWRVASEMTGAKDLDLPKDIRCDYLVLPSGHKALIMAMPANPSATMAYFSMIVKPATAGQPNRYFCLEKMMDVNSGVLCEWVAAADDKYGHDNFLMEMEPTRDNFVKAVSKVVSEGTKPAMRGIRMSL